MEKKLWMFYQFVSHTCIKYRFHSWTNRWMLGQCVIYTYKKSRFPSRTKRCMFDQFVYSYIHKIDIPYMDKTHGQNVGCSINLYSRTHIKCQPHSCTKRFIFIIYRLKIPCRDNTFDTRSISIFICKIEILFMTK